MTKFGQGHYNLKSKLRNRQKVFGAWMSLYHPCIAEIFARSSVDFIGIDIEHSTISQEQSQRLIATCQGYGTLCLPRIASHNMEMVKRLLDSGADGIIIPMVSTPEEVKQLISWCKYPPQGRRGFGVARAQGYGFDFDEYTKNWNESFSFIVQIESIQGVRNIEKILSYNEVDGAMIGPYDISGSLGIPGQLDHPRVKEVCGLVIKACAKSGKACGIHLVEPSEDSVENVFLTGYTFVVLASDIFLLWKWSERMRNLTLKIKQRK